MADVVEEMRTWGLAAPGELDRIVVISPHLDDAVLGCGRLLAAHPGTTVVTVYTGRPERYPDPPTGWDAQCGFVPGDDVLGVRRTRGRDPRRGATAVLAPFGLGNPDHDATHVAAMCARRCLPDLAWFCYEDMGYTHIPGLLAWRVARLFVAGVWPTPAALPADPDPRAKLAAAAHDASQLLALEAQWRVGEKLAAPAPEQYWRLAPPPPGWEGLADPAALRRAT